MGENKVRVLCQVVGHSWYEVYWTSVGIKKLRVCKVCGASEFQDKRDKWNKVSFQTCPDSVVLRIMKIKHQLKVSKK